MTSAFTTPMVTDMIANGELDPLAEARPHLLTLARRRSDLDA
jgi:hypothetical protein